MMILIEAQKTSRLFLTNLLVRSQVMMSKEIVKVLLRSVARGYDRDLRVDLIGACLCYYIGISTEFACVCIY